MNDDDDEPEEFSAHQCKDRRRRKNAKGFCSPSSSWMCRDMEGDGVVVE